MIMGVILSGNSEEKISQISLLFAVLEQQCIDPNMCEWEISISINGHSQLLIDKSSLLPIKRCTTPFESLLELYFIDSEIYKSFVSDSQPFALGKAMMSNSNDSEKTTAKKVKYQPFAKSTRGFAKRDSASTKTESNSTEVPLSKKESDFYTREENQTCAYAIKQSSKGYFSFYFRSGINDRGADTTFRHYVDRRDGSLIIFRYFKSIGSIKMVFSDIGKPLRYNGNNLLSSSDVHYIESQFNKHRYL